MQHFWTDFCTHCWKVADHPAAPPSSSRLEAKEPQYTPSAAVLFLVRDLSTKDIMDSDIRGVLIALIIVIVIFAIGMGGHFLQ